MEEDLLIEEMIDGVVDDGFAKDSGKETIQWNRDHLPDDFDPKTMSVPFHWLDIDMTSGSPLGSNPDGGSIIGSLEGPVPVIRLYGVTREGSSIMTCVHGFTPRVFLAITNLRIILPFKFILSTNNLIYQEN